MEKIKNLFNLKKINVSFNSLDEIHPVTFVGLINLEEIDLSCNKFLENFDIDLSNGLTV
jgi:Leucine-rich repeat (LRR) protein